MRCTACHGRGTVPADWADAKKGLIDRGRPHPEPCPECHGTGQCASGYGDAPAQGRNEKEER